MQLMGMWPHTLLTIYCMAQGTCAFDTMIVSSGMQQPLLGVYALFWKKKQKKLKANSFKTKHTKVKTLVSFEDQKEKR